VGSTPLKIKIIKQTETTPRPTSIQFLIFENRISVELFRIAIRDKAKSIPVLPLPASAPLC